MKSIRTVFLLALLGVSLSAAVGALALFALPSTLASTAYLWPGNYAAPILDKITPVAALYWLVPEGGPLAYLLLIVLGPFFAWAVLFAAVAFVIGRWVRPNNSFKPKPLRGSAQLRR